MRVSITFAVGYALAFLSAIFNGSFAISHMVIKHGEHPVYFSLYFASAVGIVQIMLLPFVQLWDGIPYLFCPIGLLAGLFFNLATMAVWMIVDMLG